MVIETKFDSIAEIAGLQRMAQTVDEQVLLRAPQSYSGGRQVLPGPFYAGFFQAGGGRYRFRICDPSAGDRQPQESRCAVTSSAPQPSGGSRRSS